MTLKKVLTKTTLTFGALFLAGAAVAKADQIIPAAAETPGSGGSYWDTTVQLYHPGNTPSVATFTLHKSGGQGTFETDYTIQPGETVTLEKILTRMGTTGSGAITIDADVDFIGEARIYNDEGEEGTQGQQFPIYNEEEILSAGDAGTVMLGADISKFRSNFGWYQHTTGTVKHELIDQNGDLVTSVTKEYAAHRHEQDEAGKYFNTALGDNWRIQTTVESGSGIGYGSVIDNTSQDPTTKKMHEIQNQTGEPRIVGIDFDGDGLVDMIDEDGDGFLDGAIDIDCNAPVAWDGWLIAEGPDSFSYFGVDMPQGMSLVQGTGKIVYDAPCSDAGQTFWPGFYISGMQETVDVIFDVH